jgi:hypothetical protein
MTMKVPGRKVYRTANGKHVDLDLLIQRNELTPAVGNARVNARGDELGAGGKIVRKREDVLKDYYNNTKGVIDEPAARPQNVVSEATAPQAQSVAEPVKKAAASKPTAAELKEFEDEWEEDAEGNFVKKGVK